MARDIGGLGAAAQNLAVLEAGEKHEQDWTRRPWKLTFNSQFNGISA